MGCSGRVVVVRGCCDVFVLHVACSAGSHGMCVYVDLHDITGGNVCGVSGRGCGGGWVDIRGYV
jgi:hypothetical protein